MAEATKRKASRSKAASGALKPRIIDLCWCNGIPEVEGPVTVVRGQRVEWRIAPGDDASEFEIDFGTRWPFGGGKRKLRRNDPADTASRAGKYDYDCTVWGPRGRTLAETKSMLVSPRIVITDPGGGMVPGLPKKLASQVEKIMKKLEGLTEELNGLRNSLGGGHPQPKASRKVAKKTAK